MHTDWIGGSGRSVATPTGSMYDQAGGWQSDSAGQPLRGTGHGGTAAGFTSSNHFGRDQHTAYGYFENSEYPQNVGPSNIGQGTDGQYGQDYYGENTTSQFSP